MGDLPDDLVPVPEADLHKLAERFPDSPISRILSEADKMRERGGNPVVGYSAKHSCLVCQDIGIDYL